METWYIPYFDIYTYTAAYAKDLFCIVIRDSMHSLIAQTHAIVGILKKAMVTRWENVRQPIYIEPTDSLAQETYAGRNPDTMQLERAVQARNVWTDITADNTYYNKTFLHDVERPQMAIGTIVSVTGAVHSDKRYMYKLENDFCIVLRVDRSTVEVRQLVCCLGECPIFAVDFFSIRAVDASQVHIDHTPEHAIRQ